RLRLAEVARDPGLLAARGEAGEIGAHRVALADGVAGRAAGAEHVLALIRGLEVRGADGVADHRLRAPREAEDVHDGGSEKLRIVNRGVAHPVAGIDVADHQGRLDRKSTRLNSS